MTTTGPLWLPSRDRTIPLFDYAAPAPRGRQATPLPRRWPSMSVADMLDFTLDGEGWVIATGDPIASATAVATPSDLTVLDCVVIGGVVAVWLAAGSADTEYMVAVTITTAAGQVVHAAVSLFVTAASAPSALSPLDLLTDGGDQIVTDGGVPITINVGSLSGPVTLPGGTVLTPQSGIPLPS